MVPTLYHMIGGDRLSHDQLIDRWRNYLRSATALTNLGEINLHWPPGPIELNNLHFTASPGTLGDFTCAAMPFKGQLQCNFVFAEPTISQATADDLSTSVTQRLTRALDECRHSSRTVSSAPASIQSNAHHRLQTNS